MAETKISFMSAGRKLAGTVRVPNGVKPGERRPAWIVMHGFGSNSSSTNVLEPCKRSESGHQPSRSPRLALMRNTSSMLVKPVSA